jgi:hypothetical protein
VYDIGLSVRCEKAPAYVQNIPDGVLLDFEYRDDHVSFVVLRIEGNQIVEVV